MILNVAILEYELIINKKLFENNIITKKQFDEVYKIILRKINNLKDNYEIL